MAMGALDDHGRPVDWWFMYKVAGKSTTASGGKAPKLGGKPVSGAEYVYFDAHSPASAKLALSPQRVDQGGALKATLDQLYGTKSDSLGWFFYNDENPITGKVNSSRGHTKGVLAFDLASNTAFWLIQSTPKFALKDRYGYPKTGMPNAQTLLCITLADATVAQSIAKQMFVAQQPNVYLASDLPAALKSEPNDARLKLMQDQVASGNTPVHVVVPFLSKGGQKFISIAKNRTWNLDFYNDLVGPTLHENLDVETWEHDPEPPALDSDKVHQVVAMKEVDLSKLDIDLAWSEEDDHAKLAVSDPAETEHWVCVGDINFTIAQRKRGGGTVAFQNEALWTSLTEILTRTTPAPPGSAPRKAAARTAAAAAKKSAPAKKTTPAKQATPAKKTAAAKAPAARKAVRGAR